MRTFIETWGRVTPIDRYKRPGLVGRHCIGVDAGEAQAGYGIALVPEPAACACDAIIIAVAHDQFKAMGAPALRALGKPKHVLYDLKYALPAGASDLRL